jgi:hypothetical protein
MPNKPVEQNWEALLIGRDNPPPRLLFQGKMRAGSRFTPFVFVLVIRRSGNRAGPQPGSTALDYEYRRSI